RARPRLVSWRISRHISAGRSPQAAASSNTAAMSSLAHLMYGTFVDRGSAGSLPPAEPLSAKPVERDRVDPSTAPPSASPFPRCATRRPHADARAEAEERQTGRERAEP